MYLNLKYINDLDDKNKIVWQINYADSPYAYDAGGLKLSEVENDRRQARKNNIDFYNHLTHLIIHSFLHINDYLHKKITDYLAMKNIEINILRQLGIHNPY